MKNQEQNHDDSIELPLTEEEYEDAHPECQIRSLIEVNDVHRVVNRDDVKKVFDMRAGHKERRNQIRDNIADTRLRILLYIIPTKGDSQKYLYRVEGPVEIAHREILDQKPKHHVIVEDSERFVRHAYENGDDIDDCFEFGKAINDMYGKWSLLADYVEQDLKELLEE